MSIGFPQPRQGRSTVGTATARCGAAVCEKYGLRVRHGPHGLAAYAVSSQRIFTHMTQS